MKISKDQEVLTSRFGVRSEDRVRVDFASARSQLVLDRFTSGPLLLETRAGPH